MGNDKRYRDNPKLTAGIDLICRTGALSVQIRYCDEEKPVVWIALAEYDRKHFEADIAFHPVDAVLRLCERLIDGGKCTHCERQAGFSADSLETMPLDDLICWYQYDPELRTFRRGCEGEKK